MIEVTAKQIAEIYKDLPDAEEWFYKYANRPYGVPIMSDKDMRVNRSFSHYRPTLSCMMNEVLFEVDADSCPFEWKPKTDLIIKS